MTDKPRDHDDKIKRIDSHEDARRHIQYLRGTQEIGASGMIRPSESYTARDLHDERVNKELKMLDNTMINTFSTAVGAIFMAISGYDMATKSYDIITKTNLGTVMTPENMAIDAALWIGGAAALSYGAYRILRKEKG